MGSDNIIEAEVITPQGDLMKVNECENSDLFWAIRGGGGSTFGVIISMTVKAYPMPSVAVINFDVSPKNGTSTKQWWTTVARLHKKMADLQDMGYAGYYTITGNPMLWHNTVFVYNATSAQDGRKKVLPLETALQKVDYLVKTEISELYTDTWYQLIEQLGSLTASTDVGKRQTVRASRLVTRKAIDDTGLFAQTLEKIGPNELSSKVQYES
jgi:FAD/FMN-containing dehydrogenase